jgi:hypothetical protein
MNPSCDHGGDDDGQSQSAAVEWWVSLELATLRPEVDSPASIPRPSTPNLMPP